MTTEELLTEVGEILDGLKLPGKPLEVYEQYDSYKSRADEARRLLDLIPARERRAYDENRYRQVTLRLFEAKIHGENQLNTTGRAQVFNTFDTEIDFESLARDPVQFFRRSFLRSLGVEVPVNSIQESCDNFKKYLVVQLASYLSGNRAPHGASDSKSLDIARAQEERFDRLLPLVEACIDMQSNDLAFNELTRGTGIRSPEEYLSRHKRLVEAYQMFARDPFLGFYAKYPLVAELKEEILLDYTGSPSPDFGPIQKKLRAREQTIPEELIKERGKLEAIADLRRQLEKFKVGRSSDERGRQLDDNDEAQKVIEKKITELIKEQTETLPSQLKKYNVVPSSENFESYQFRELFINSYRMQRETNQTGLHTSEPELAVVIDRVEGLLREIIVEYRDRGKITFAQAEKVFASRVSELYEHERMFAETMRQNKVRKDKTSEVFSRLGSELHEKPLWV